MPAAAGLFSTITRWPSASPSLSATKRAGMSVGPPAPKPTTSRIGGSDTPPVRCAAALTASAEQRKRATNVRPSFPSFASFCRGVLAEVAQQRFLVVQKLDTERVARRGR
jgi:hypothetical protein